MKRSYFLGLFLIAMLIWTPIPVIAADSGALRLETSPLPINLSTVPGKPVTTSLRVRNDGDHTETLKVGLLKFSANGESGSPKLMEREPGDDFFDWVTFSRSQLTVEPGMWQDLTMTISPPDSAALGYYYAVTFARANEKVTPGNQQNALVGATATLVLLDVEVPNAKREVKVAQFSTDRPWYEFLPVGFTVKLRNSGNIHVAPAGNIFISQQSNTVARLDINKAKGNILPGSVRLFDGSWNDGFPVYQSKLSNQAVVLDQQGHPVNELHWDFSQANKLRFGHYTAHLLLAYDNRGHDVPVEATTSFWVIPWRLFLGVGVIILFMGVGVIVTVRSLWRRIARRQ